MDNELIAVLVYIAVMVLGVGLGAYIRGQGVKETIAEIKADKERINEWTGKLADATPTHALDAVNKAAQNAQEITRFLLAAQFPGVPFTSQLREIAEIAGNVADIVEDVTDKTQEPVAPFADKGVQKPAA